MVVVVAERRAEGPRASQVARGLCIPWPLQVPLFLQAVSTGGRGCVCGEALGKAGGGRVGGEGWWEPGGRQEGG